MRLQSDERLVALTRRGNQAAYEALVARYQSRLLAFCRHMLSSREDAEDVLQEVFAAAFNALMGDDRPINVRPWLYRIARNRSLNHLRRTQPIGVDSMDVHLADHGTTTADRVHRREDFRELVGDVQELPETQRTALLLREIDALSYEQIADAMETTVPSVKSLLVRARVSLAEAAEARRMTCEEVRVELGEVAEGLQRKTPPVRRHVRQCERCAAFDKQLRATNRALAAAFPIGPLLLLKKFLITQGASSAAATSATAAAGAGASVAGAGAGSALTAGIGAVVTKTAAGLAAAAIVTAGAVEVDHSQHRPATRAHVVAQAPAAPQAHAVAAAPRVVATTPQPAATVTTAAKPGDAAAEKHADGKAAGKQDARAIAAVPGDVRKDGATAPAAVPEVLASAPQPAAVGQAETLPATPETGSDTATLPGHPAAATPATPIVLPSPPPAVAAPQTVAATAEPAPAAPVEPAPPATSAPAPAPVASPAPAPAPAPAATTPPAAPAPPAGQ
jgi:RNA polymerase sigma factor (sigma-70 family)